MDGKFAMAGNGWKWPEMARNDWKQLKRLEMVDNNWKLKKMAQHVWKIS